MSYLDLGFNENLSVAEVGSGDQLNPQAFEQLTADISGAKISGLINSQNGRLQMNLDQNSFIVSDGVIERVRLGKLADGTYGFLVKDNNGNDLMQIGDINVIQSPDKSLELNFDTTQLLVKDAGGTPIILLGKQQGGF